MNFLYRLSLLAFLIVSSCTTPKKPPEPFKVHVILSVQWEGESLEEKNLEAMKDFYQKFPSYTLSHFLSPSYFNNKKINLSRSEITKKIKSALGPKDELGLYIPSFNKGDIQKTLLYSLKTLKKNGFKDIQSYGLKNGVALPEDQKSSYFKDLPIEKIKVDSKDFNLIQNDLDHGNSTDEALFFRRFLDLVDQAKSQNKKSIYLHYSWRQEWALKPKEVTRKNKLKKSPSPSIKQVEGKLKKLESYCHKHGYKILPLGFSEYLKKDLH